MLQGILLISVIGFLAGEIAGLFKLPKLIGMLISGILMGPYVLDILPESILLISEEIRIFVLLVILFKAGLGLDKEKIMSQGTVAVRLGFLPALLETIVVAGAVRWLLGWEWLLAFLLGWIICAESPAVIVPMMLKLKALGRGVKKGIPDIVLAGASISDAFAITMFGITVAWVLGDMGQNIWSKLGSIPLKIILGIIFGFIAGKLVLFIVNKINITGEVVQELIIGLGMGLLLIIGEEYIPYSDFLAIMVMGFVILELDAVLARRLRRGVDEVWNIGEIFLFVLIGAAVNIQVIYSGGLTGLAIIGIGLLLGRTSGIILSTWGSTITLTERSFMVVGLMPKATVQAAIGGIPLSLGIEYGEYILAIAVLSIIVTAPLGAFGTSLLAPRLLKKGKVDPTKVTVKEKYAFLVAVDGSEVASKALQEAARVARQVNAKLIIINVFNEKNNKISTEKLEQELLIVRDIDHEVVIDQGQPSDLIVSTALSHNVDYIYIGKSSDPEGRDSLIGYVSKKVIEKSPVPVILVENNRLNNFK